MAWRFRKSISLGKGVRLNLGKKGIGVSAGVKGFRVGVNSKGVYRSMSIPGTGLYNQEYIKSNKNSGKSTASASSSITSSETPVYNNSPSSSIPGQLMYSTNLFYVMMAVSFILLFIWWQVSIVGFIAAIIYYNQSENTKTKKLYTSAQAAVSSGNTTVALENFKKVSLYDPTINLDLELAAAHSSSGNKVEAIKYYENSLQSNPNDETLKYKLIEEYYESGNYDKAVTAIQNLPPEDKQQLPMINMLGSAFLKLNKPDLALEVLLTGPTRKRKMTDDLMKFRYLLGLTYNALGETKKALNQFKKVYVENKDYEDVSELIEKLSPELTAGRDIDE